MELDDPIVQVFLIFTAAKAAGQLLVLLRQPAIVGELLVGVVLGPALLGWIDVGAETSVLAELGIVVLLFTAGLETRLGDLLSVGRPALLSSLGGMAVTIAAGVGTVSAFGHPGSAAVLAGVALAASSVGIAARAFSDLGSLRSRVARTVLGAAILDDVAVLAFLPLAQGVGSGASLGAALFGLGGAAAFVVLVAGAGSRLARRHAQRLAPSATGRGPFVLALGLCLGLALLAEGIGLAALVGAFLAGMVVAETHAREQVAERMEPLFELLVPFFFVVSAAQVDLEALGGGGLPFVGTLVAGTLLAKLVGCSAGAMGLGFGERLTVGAGMLPRGEVTIAVATAGLAARSLDAAVFAALLAAVLASNLVAPVLLRAVTPGARPRHPRTDIPPEAFDVDEPDPS